MAIITVAQIKALVMLWKRYMIFYVNVFGCHGFCRIWKDNRVIATCLLAKVNWSTWSLIVNEVLFTKNSARKWEPLTDFSRIDLRHDIIVTKKSVDLSHQRYKIRNCHWKLFFAFPFLYFSFFVTNTVMAHEIQFFSVVFNSDLYLIYIQTILKDQMCAVSVIIHLCTRRLWNIL